MRVGFIGDIIGKHGRVMLEHHLKALRTEERLDVVIANGENTSHGFGLNLDNAKELVGYGVDCITGGNHSFDKSDIKRAFEELPVIRPLNYPSEVMGRGYAILDVGTEKIAIINLMGIYGMPHSDNPFRLIAPLVESLRERGIVNIVLDMHAEATAEKRTVFEMLKGRVSAICGTHTHVGTDDYTVNGGTFYVSDVGLTGCYDGVIGMESTVPIMRSMTGLGGRYDLPKKCHKIFQMVVFEIEYGKATWGKKIKIFEDGHRVSSEAYRF